MKHFTKLFLSAALLASLFFPSPKISFASPTDHVMITEVYYDTNLSGEPEEYVAVSNPTAAAVDISNWAITNGTNAVKFPSPTSIAAGQTLYVTKTANSFKSEMVTIAPAFEYGSDSDPAVPQMVVSGTIPVFANAGGQVQLKNGSTIVDGILYGSTTATCTCWTGSPIPTVAAGVIMVRDRVESTGLWEETDSAADWNGLRVYQAGQSRFDTPTFTYTGDVTTYTSPDSSYNAVTNLFNSATTSIDLNIYEFESTYLLNTIKQAMARGVKVRVFLEGQPVGGLTDQTKYVAQQIVNAGGQVRFIINDTANQRFKRYRFDHAKYTIVDGSKAMLQSENFKSTGTPTTNSYGNRGWGIIINNAGFASYVQNVFNYDWNVNFKDSFPYTPGTAYGEPTAGFVPDTSNPAGSYPVPFTSQTITGTFNVTPVFAPDSTFLKEKAIIGTIRNAQKSLHIEQLYIHKHWGTATTGDPVTTPDIYLEEVINAARRGVEVRVILDSAFLDPTDSRDNQFTVKYINDTAAVEKLNMSAKLMNLTATHVEKVHNKGVIADGNKVLVSSINWSQNSPENNREAGVIVENANVGAFYEKVFNWDWNDGVVANKAPVVVNPIANQTATVGGGNVVVDATNTFSDPDGDALTLTATSSNTGIATVSVAGKIFTISPVAAGTATITVTANDGRGGTASNNFTVTANPAAPVVILNENFETGSKTAYAAADVVLSSGSWRFDNALLGTLTTDRKNGTKAARIQSGGFIAMTFDVAGAKTVKLSHANFSADTGANWKLQKSTDEGATWTDVTGLNASTSTLTQQTITVNYSGNVRFRIYVSGTAANRINIDDFSISN
ncbi:phospholipase D-like domain-containing protein [Paenibacillus sp. SI8]|uniref:phospholipase D-like domain-containing protein n=1 Tax=unclassified Paenibacillus TaxID=185978 RepID=UPI003467B5AB